jgi:hypothetical protein
MVIYLFGKNKSQLPKIKLWDGTTVHASIDTLLMQDITLKLKELGFDAEHKAWWSLEDLHNGKVAFVTHTRRLATVNPYSVSQRDSEKFMIQMFKGALPKNISMMVAAHGHTMRGTIDDEPFRIINSPCFTSFLEYPKALANFMHFQPDIGAVFIIITKEGRTRIQPWIYHPFVYNHNESKIYESNNDTHKFVEMKDKQKEKVEIEPYLKAMCKDARFIVCVIADLHCGEVGAIAPEKYVYNGMEYNVTQTLANARLFEYWKNLVATCKELKPHEIWVVGDVTAGTQIFEKNRRTLTQNLEEQKAMVVELFKEFLK